MASTWRDHDDDEAEIRILHAGQDSQDGSQPHTWIGIAEAGMCGQAEATPLTPERRIGFRHRHIGKRALAA